MKASNTMLLCLGSTLGALVLNCSAGGRLALDGGVISDAAAQDECCVAPAATWIELDAGEIGDDMATPPISVGSHAAVYVHVDDFQSTLVEFRAAASFWAINSRVYLGSPGLVARVQTTGPEMRVLGAAGTRYIVLARSTE